ncbi:MAG: S8 family serine peptidase, partial [Acidimicrobiales bacterium]
MTRRLAGAALAGLFAGVVAPLPVAPAHATVQCEVGKTHFINRFSQYLLSPAFAKSWPLATGKGVTVAVVDSGVDTDNAHMSGDTVLPGKSFVPGPATQDDYGHGTAVAGIIAAQRLPSGKSGLIGAAPGATILPVRVFDQEKTQDSSGPVSYPPNTVRLAEGIRWAAGHGADVINVSLSTPPDDPDLPTLKSAVRFAHRQDALVVASGGDASGSSVTQPKYPAASPHVIGVAATNANGVVDNYSVHGADIDVSAPGQGIMVAYHANGDCLSNQQPYTSWATPFVSAEAAILREKYPKESADHIAYRIKASASRPIQGKRDDDQGWGEIRPYVALTMTLDPHREGPTLPGHRSAPPPKATARNVHPLASTTSPLESVQREGLWWGLGALGLAALALILKPLVEITRRR